MDKPYQRLKVACNLSFHSLEQCALNMRPSHSYKLYVTPTLYTTAVSICRRMAAIVEDNPFAPYVNIIINKTLGPWEWFIEGDAGDAWGSEGV